jgi:RimJ/RimL family protein N-acetyltransferase
MEAVMKEQEAHGPRQVVHGPQQDGEPTRTTAIDVIRVPGVPDLSMRAVRPTDKAALMDLFDRLSPRSRLLRFLRPKTTLSAGELEYFTNIDHLTHEALAAVASDGQFVGVVRYACAPGETTVAEVAFAVADAWHGRGIASALGHLLIDQARRNGIARLEATTLAENHVARRLLRRFGFVVCASAGGVIELAMQLSDTHDAVQHAA